MAAVATGDTVTRDGGLLCAGRVYCDLVFRGLARWPTLGQEIFCDGVSLHGGGGAWITAAWLTALQRPATLCATLPGPPFDTVLAGEARAHGLSLSECDVGEPDDPQLTVAMLSDGDRAFLTRRSGPALPSSHEAALARHGLAHVHIGELTTLLEHPDLPARARRHGLTVSLDCGWDDVALQRDDLGAHLSGIDVFLPNQAEFDALPADARHAAGLTVIKRGASGACAHGKAGIDIEAAAPITDALDTTGAGDAFDAGFLDAWLAGLSIEACLERANACGAAAVVRRGGASGLPAREQLIAQRSPA